MKRLLATGVAGTLSFALVACGGGDADSSAPSPAPAPAAAPAAAPSGGVSAADWIVVDQAARTVTITLVAGQTTANNRWNYNGYSNGGATVVVPQGFAVTIDFSNDDPANLHSVAVLNQGTFPATFDAGTTPVFPGAMSANATSMTEATRNGEPETLTFTAATAGQYALVCLIPAHALTGMWIGFEVSSSGESGLKM